MKKTTIQKAYTLLIIPFVISVINLLLLVAGVIFAFVNGIGYFDVEAVSLFFVLIMGLGFLPSIIADVLQIIFFIIGKIKLRTSEKKYSRVCGIICALSLVVSNIDIVCRAINSVFNKESQKDFIIFKYVSCFFIFYGLFILRLLIKSRNEDRVVQ